MGLSEKLLLIIVGGVIIFAIVGARAASPTAKPGCPNKCGDVEIPFPFGSTEACYLDDSFNITCQSGKPMIGDVPVTNISIENHGVHVLPFVAEVCYDKVSGLKINTYNSTIYFWAAQTQYTISNSKNKFIVLGCDTFAYLNGFQNGEKYTIGCSSQCISLINVINGSCSGVGCCEVGFPDGLKVIQVDVYSRYNHTNVRNFNPCSYAFFVENGKFNFSTDYLMDLGKEKLPMVLDWAVGNETCAEAQDKPNFACQENSACLDLQTRQGYRCNCKQGYKGNPYLHGGCQDVDECGDPTLNNCATPKNCINTQGNYTCGCPKSYHGDGRKDGLGCAADLALALTIKIAIGVGISLIAILGGISWVYFVLKNRRFVKLREKFFRQNGGLILEQQLKEHARSTEAAKIFSMEELKKATKDYDESRIIGRGGYGIVYKGILPDNRIVAIKKSKIVSQNQIDQFINEVVLLSQINHKNVVKLLGCCLETEVPLLVYEFVSKGTLFNYIHHESSTSTTQWETSLRIAAETADALSYLHSTTSTPIIHRDVKSTNILLDDNFTAKVSDFGTSRLVPRDQNELVTVVQGTIGYLDPEYLQTNQLTEKSDVYSFGVVLVELLTREKALSFNRSEEERSLAMYFLSSLKENRLFEILDNRIVEEGNEEQIKEIVELAERCLRVKGDERPTMKEVAMELELLRKTKTHPWVNVQSNLEEAEHMLGETSDAYEYGGRSSSTTIDYTMHDHETFPLRDGR